MRSVDTYHSIINQVTNWITSGSFFHFNQYTKFTKHEFGPFSEAVKFTQTW